MGEKWPSGRASGALIFCEALEVQEETKAGEGKSKEGGGGVSVAVWKESVAVSHPQLRRASTAFRH